MVSTRLSRWLLAVRNPGIMVRVATA